jgi:O-antigen/teichoic acid export membrane protein
MQHEHLHKTALRGGALVGGAQMVKMAVQFLSVVILSRLLIPEDFGLIASLAPVISFIILFQDLGLQQAVVQRAEISREQMNRVFWSTALLGSSCAFVVFLASPAVAWFYHDSRLVAITMASSLPLLIGSLCTLPQGLLNREMRFGTLAVIDICSVVSGFLTALTAALLGAGYWSMVFSAITAVTVTLIGSWIGSGWKPDKPQWRLRDKQFMAFGANLTGFNVMNFFARNLDNILIGRQLGSVPLGYYDRAYKLLLFPLQNINAPISKVMTPLLSRLQSDPVRFRESYLRTAGLITLVTVPGMAAMMSVSSELITLLFGARWQPVAPIFAWLGLAGLLQPLNNSTGWIFIAQAYTRTMFRWGLYSSATVMASFIVGLHWGAVGVAAAYAITEYILRLPVLYAVVGRAGPITARDMAEMQFPLLAAAALTWLITQYALRPAGVQGLLLIAASVIIAYALSVALLALLPGGRRTLHDSLKLFHKGRRFLIPAA